MKTRPNSFADLFRRLRVLSGFFSLNDLSQTLDRQGLKIDLSVFSRWQTGTRIPKDRETLLFVIQAFYKRGGISVKEANQLLESAKFGYLTENEQEEIFHLDHEL